jgi:hypothetical protein
MTPYAPAGNYTSPVFDAGGTVTWVTTSWTATLPAGSNAVVRYRTGNTPTPDGGWTQFATIPSSGAASLGSATPVVSRYLQFTVQETTTDAGQTPVLKDITIAYRR